MHLKISAPAIVYILEINPSLNRESCEKMNREKKQQWVSERDLLTHQKWSPHTKQQQGCQSKLNFSWKHLRNVNKLLELQPFPLL